MRVAIVTESFLPQVNGVTNSVLRVCEQMERRGHEVLVVAPGPGPQHYAGARVIRTPSIPLPCYRDFRIGRPWAGMAGTLEDFRPDVVHLASPTVLGAQAGFLAKRMGLPVVAVYQTDLAGFASRYRLGGADRAVWSWLRTVHSVAARTLAPSRHAVDVLTAQGVEHVVRWARGVDMQRFTPTARCEQWRQQRAPAGEVVVGYVGRLAAEKEVELLAGLAGVPKVRLVVVGDGPQRASLQRKLPSAAFLGFQGGAQLSTAYASLDVFVHTGSHETFCQAAQEALASGVPVVAPAAGGLLDLVQPGDNGLHFRPGSSVDLRRQVGRLVDDESARIAMGLGARRSVLGRTWEVIGDQLVGHYEEVVA
ncbi:MAG: glycosyltransferase family 1 protein [Actinobacteria bacterium]|nr:glycosyltransferase family 1 protein [Actinomycetota bacterium]